MAVFSFLFGYFAKIRKFIIDSWIKFYSDMTALYSLFEGCFKDRISMDVYPDRKGDVAVVTGGARGLGEAIVKGFVKCGIHVIIAVRKPDQCKQLVKDLQEIGPGTVETMQIDTSSLKSIKTFAEELNKKYPKIKYLVNNAGIIYSDNFLTEDGFEKHIGTNYIGHFYLTHLLMKNLLLSGKTSGRCSRIVNVSSCCHSITKIHFDDINLQNGYNKYRAYAQSKLALLMSARYLNRHAESKGIPIRAYSCHPGIISSGMLDQFIKNNPSLAFGAKLTKTCDEGAVSTLHACLSEDLEEHGGQYIIDKSEGWSSSYSKNEKEQERLFNYTCNLLKIKEFGNK